MRRGAILLLGLLAVLAAGCLTEEPVKSSQWAERFRQFSYTNTANVVQLHFYLIERPLGDPYINKEVWKYTDEEVMDLSQKALLEQNGIRVGQVVGSLPASVQKFLSSDRFCVKKQDLVRVVGREMPISLGPVLSTCRFRLFGSAQPLEIELYRAECFFQVVANFTDDGKTRLLFTPRIEYWESQYTIRAAADRSGWVPAVEKPNKLFTDLSGEVTLSPNDWLVVGCSLDKEQTFAYQALVDRESSTPIQRLLVIRTSRTGTVGIDAEISETPLADAGAAPQVQPLALQATASAKGAN